MTNSRLTLTLSLLLTLTLSLLLTLTLLTSCSRRTPYHMYEAVNGTEWRMSDTIHFETDTIRHKGHYVMAVGVRATQDYPYTELQMMAEVQVDDKKPHSIPVTLNIKDDGGRMEGDGVTCITLEQNIDTMKLHRGDVVRAKVYHLMRQEELQGIREVGFEVRRK